MLSAAHPPSLLLVANSLSRLNLSLTNEVGCVFHIVFYHINQLTLRVREGGGGGGGERGREGGKERGREGGREGGNGRWEGRERG